MLHHPGLPRLVSRVAELTQSRDTYIRVRTGPRTSHMTSVGRIDVKQGHVIDADELVQDVWSLIQDNASVEAHAVELCFWNGKKAEILQRVIIQPSEEAVAMQADQSVKTDGAFEALVTAVVTLAQSANSRANAAQSAQSDLLVQLADLRVTNTELTGMLEAKAPPIDPRIEAAQTFKDVIGPVMPTILERMKAARGGGPPPNHKKRLEVKEVEEEVEVEPEDIPEMIDVLLGHLDDLTSAAPDVWKDTGRQTRVATLAAKIQAGLVEPAPDADPPLTDEP